MSTRRIIYIAGPYTAKTPWQIELNCRAAEESALEVWKAGHVPVVPHLLGRYFHGELNEGIVLSGLLKLLRRCDGVLLLPGHERSPGTAIEISEANRVGIPCRESLDLLLGDINYCAN